MIYFSEIQGRKVVTEDQVLIGKLEDIIFHVSNTPTITKIVVRGTTLKEKLIIPTSYLKKINHSLVVGKDYSISSLEENELHLLKNLLDKQIIDLKGNKIVRVNDVAIQEKGGFYIAGVDIGILGILREIGLEKFIIKFLSRFGVRLTSQFLSWGDIQPLELVHGAVKLRKHEEKLQKIRPADLADYLERTNITNAQKFLKMLSEKRAAEVIEKLNLNYRAALFRNYKSEKAATFLAHIAPDEAVDILLTIPSKKRLDILNYLSDKRKQELNYLLKYSTTQIGNLLTSDFLTVNPDDLTGEVVDKIKKETNDFSFLNNVYVVNKGNQLSGVFNIHELLLQEPGTPVYKFMNQNVVVFHLTTPAEIGLNLMIKYKLQSIPVIDKERKIIGVVTVVDLVESLRRKLS